MASKLCSLSSLAFALVACAASPPPKAEAVVQETTSSAAGTAGSGSSGEPASNTPAVGSSVTATDQPKNSDSQADGAGSTPAPSPGTSEPSAAEPKFFPIDVVTGPDMAYLIDYANSGVAEVAKKGCSGKVEEDASKHADCLTKAREKFGGDVLRFKKDSKGHVKLTIYRRSGSALTEMYSSNVDLKELNPHVVKVEIKGGVGQRPIVRDGGTFEVAVPNGYSLEIQDSVYGKLVYEAKVGLLAH